MQKAFGAEMKRKEHAKIVECFGFNLSCITFVQIFHVIKTQTFSNIHDWNEPRRCLTAWLVPSMGWFHPWLIWIYSTKTSPCEKQRNIYDWAQGRVEKGFPKLVSNVQISHVIMKELLGFFTIFVIWWVVTLVGALVMRGSTSLVSTTCLCWCPSVAFSANTSVTRSCCFGLSTSFGFLLFSFVAVFAC